MSSSDLEILRAQYQAGRDSFERGLYRESVQYLEKASALASRSSRLGGEVQMWLVTAYEAAGQRQEAIALCQQLNHHPDLETRKQSRRILYILEAPKLNTRPEWLTQIPDLTAIEDGKNSANFAAAPPQGKPAAKPAQWAPETVDLSQVNTRDNRFIWIAIAIAVLVLGGLLWAA